MADTTPSSRSLCNAGYACPIAAYSTPLLYRPPDGPLQLVATDTMGITSLDLGSGKLNWEVNNVFHARCVGS